MLHSISMWFCESVCEVDEPMLPMAKLILCEGIWRPASGGPCAVSRQHALPLEAAQLPLRALVAIDDRTLGIILRPWDRVAIDESATVDGAWSLLML